MYEPQEQRLKVVYDISGAKIEMQLLDDLLKKQGLTLLEVTHASTKFKAGLDGVIASIKGTTVEGQTFSATLKKVEDEVVDGTLVIKAMTKELEDSAEAFREDARAVEESIRAHQKREAIIKKATEATVKRNQEELRQGQAAHNKREQIAQEFVNANKKRDEEELKRGRDTHEKREKYIRESAVLRQRAADKERRDLDAMLQAYQRQEDAIAASQRRLADLNRQRVNSSIGETIGGSLASQASTSPQLINATPGEIAAVTSAIGNIRNALSQGTITAKNFQDALRAVATGGIQNLNASQQRAVDLVHQYNKATTELGRSASSKYNNETREIQRISISWQGMIRLIEVQLLHSLVTNAINAFQTARQEAQQFSIAIAEIETLSQRASLSTQQWTDGVLKLSDAFGKSPAEIAAATYETISNQVAEGAEAFEHMNNVLNLASVTMATAAQAGNLLDSIINSYGVSTAQSAKISAELFKAVDLGRFKVEDLSGSFGHTAVLGRNLNITYQELLASLSALTVQGISAEESQTLLSNVLIALIKPSKQMNELLKEWGVSSGEAAIQTFGFFEVLRKFEAAAQSGGDRFAEIGQIFQNIRAIRGFEGLSNAMDRAEKNLKEITNSANEYDKAIEIINESSGKRLQIEQQRIANAFMRIGESFNVALLEAGEFFGGYSTGINKILADTEQFVRLLPILTAGILSAAVATGTLTRALTFAGAFTPFGGISLALTGLAAGYSIFTESAVEANLRLQRSIEEVGEKFDKAHKDIKRAREEIFIKQSEEIEKSLTGSFSIFLRYAAEQTKIGNQLSTNLTDGLKASLKSLESVYDLIEDKGDAVRDNLRETARAAENEAKKAERAAQDAQKEIDRLRDKIGDRNKSFDDKIFDQSLDGLSNSGKDEAIEERAVQLITEAREARQLKNFDLANQKYEDANKLLEKQRDVRQRINEEIRKEQDKILDKAKDSFLDKKKSAEDILAIQKAFEIQQKRTKIAELEERIERLQAQRAGTRPGGARDKQLVGSIESAQAQIAKLDALGSAKQKLIETDGFQKALLAELNAFDQERIGHQQELLRLAKAQADQKKAEAAAHELALKNQEKAFDHLKDLLGEADNKDLKFGDFAKLNTQIQQALGAAGLDKEAQLTLSRELNNRQRLLQAQVELEKTQSTERDIVQKIQQQKKFTESIKETNLKIKELTDSQLENQKGFEASLVTLDSFIAAVEKFSGVKGQGGRQERVDALKEAREKLNPNSKTIVEDLSKVTQLVRRLELFYRDSALGFAAGNATDNAGIKDLDEFIRTAFDQARALSSSNEEIVKQTKLLQQQAAQLRTINAAADALKLKYPDLASSAESSLPKIELQWSNINVQLAEQLRLIGQVAQAYSFISGQVPGGQQPAGRALGGPVGYYALGGFPGMPRGGDTIPIWAKAGESIINDKSSRAYAPLIRAINQTRTQHLSSGGEVTNIGDVSISLPNVQKASEVEVRQLVNKIRRQARRGNTSF